MTARVYGSFEPVLIGFPIDIEGAGAADRSGEQATTMTSSARRAATRRIGPSAGVDVDVQLTRDHAPATAQPALRKTCVTIPFVDGTRIGPGCRQEAHQLGADCPGTARDDRSEEHTSELQSPMYL